MKIFASVAAGLLAGAISASAAAAPVVFSAAGADAASINAAVEDFRAELGLLNANLPGSVGSGRREINWDGVPDDFSSPNAFPADFFNQPVAGRARGVLFSTPGTDFQVSADTDPGLVPVEFGNIDPSYTGLFATFSPERLFTAVGSNIVDVSFFVPGSATPALVEGFGAVFTDVDLADTTSIEFFGADNQSLGTFFAPAAVGDETLSFLGVSFDEGAVVSRVRITSGNVGPGPGVLETAGVDLVVMDDFIFGEPIARQQVPEPGSLALFGLAALLGMRRRRYRQ